MCDVLHRQARQVEVRFVCSDQSGAAASNAGQSMSTTPVLMSVNEVSTCEYLAIVSVPALCRHPLFSPALPTVHEIVCTPIADTAR